ncbi:MAG: proline--tRNA ligase [Planctomycetes bacterium]|nr:proline--tRNA ligase [Planctomycetota bacterium]
MATYWTRTLIPTLRQDPAEAEVPSHRLMLRAGLIRQLSAGLYTYLPLGWRALHKAIQIVRAEMDAAGAAEMFMPAIEPIELLAETKREIEYGPDLFRFEDRRGHVNALAPTHEEVITEAMRAYVESYRQLPLNLYQIQTKFRDEPRPRFGVLRCREFIMKDAYSFHLTVDGPGGLDETYRRMYDAYCRIFDRCGLHYEIVEAESGPIGGSASHEFMVICDTGEDTILKSDKGNYSANVDKCAIGERKWTLDGSPTGELETMHTPDCASIEAVGKFMRVKPKHILKIVLYQNKDITDITRDFATELSDLARVSGRAAPREHLEAKDKRGESTSQSIPHLESIVAVVRGDHAVNEGKLSAAAGCNVELMNPDAAQRIGLAVGFVSPSVMADKLDLRVRGLLVVDPDAAQDQFWASGANEIDHHVKHFNWKRDVLDLIDSSRIKVADIRNAADGDPSPIGDGGVLRVHKGIEVGHVFKLGTKYSDAMGFTVLDENQKQRPVIMGCYGIGLGRILAAAIETSHDEDGIIWPAAIAPYCVHIVPIKFDGELCKTCSDLAGELEAAGLDVLIDDRPERPGVKFKDADLIGCPIRLTVSDKTLAKDSVELKLRRERESKGELVRRDEIVARCADIISGMSV